MTGEARPGCNEPDVTPSGNLREFSTATSEEVGRDVHRGRNFRGLEVVKMAMTLLMDMGDSRVILYSRGIGQRWAGSSEEGRSP